MHILLNLLIRGFVVAGGLLLAAGLAVLGVLMLGMWGGRTLWAKLTGRPAMPFIIRIDPRGGFERMYRSPMQAAAAPSEAGGPVRPGIGDVTDVEPRPLGR